MHALAYPQLRFPPVLPVLGRRAAHSPPRATETVRYLQAIANEKAKEEAELLKEEGNNLYKARISALRAHRRRFLVKFKV